MTKNRWDKCQLCFKDTSQYLKAWEISKCRSARAMRSLGAFKVSKKLFKEAVECFEKSLKVNYMQVRSSHIAWSNFAQCVILVCCFLRLEHGSAWDVVPCLMEIMIRPQSHSKSPSALIGTWVLNNIFSEEAILNVLVFVELWGLDKSFDCVCSEWKKVIFFRH